ncbi:MAG: hypothetical protein WC712_06555 [Candidatus Brocadiia bacterium]
MLKKFGLLAMALLAFAALPTVAPVADEMPSGSITKYLPANTIFVAEFNDFKSSYTRAQELGVVKMMNDPEVKAFFESLQGMNPNNAQDMEKFSELIKFFQEIEPLAAGLFKGYGSLAVVTANQKEKSAYAVLAVQIEQGKGAEGAELIKKILEKVTQLNPDKQMDIKTETIGKYEATRIAENGEKPDNEAGYYTFTDNYFILGVGKTSLVTALEAMDAPPAEPMSAKPELLKAYSMHKSKEGFFFLNLKALCDLMTEQAEPERVEDLAKMKEVVRFVPAISGGMTFDGPNFDEQLILHFGDVPEFAMVRSLQAKALSFATASLMPKEPMFYGAMSMSAAEILEDLPKIIPNAAQMEAGFAMVEQATGISVRDKLLPAIGDEVGFYVTMAGMMPEYLAVVTLNDPVIVSTMLDGLVAIPDGPVTEVGTFKDHKLFAAGAGQGNPNAPVFCVHQNFLLVGGMLALKNTINRNPEASLATNDTFKEALAGFGDTKHNAFVFFDTKKAFDAAYNFVPMVAGPMAANLPAKEVFTQYITPQAFSFKVNGDHAILRARGFLPGSVILMGAGAAMFFSASRMERRPPPDGDFPPPPPGDGEMPDDQNPPPDEQPNN